MLVLLWQASPCANSGAVVSYQSALASLFQFWTLAFLHVTTNAPCLICDGNEMDRKMIHDFMNVRIRSLSDYQIIYPRHIKAAIK